MRREMATCSWPIGLGKTLMFTIYDYGATRWKSVPFPRVMRPSE